MNSYIIKSKVNLSRILGVDSVFHEGYFYHLLRLEGRTLQNRDLLKFLADNCKDSKYIDLWKAKEEQYDFEDPEEICYNEEYFKVKSEITKDIFQAVVFDKDQELFEVRVEVVGSYKDFQDKGYFELAFISNYRDCIMCTPYFDVDYSSIENYIKTRNNFVL